MFAYFLQFKRGLFGAQSIAEREESKATNLTDTGADQWNEK